MNSIARFIALSLFVAIAISAATGTFGSTTAYSATGASATLYTNGYVVALTTAGWVYGDTLTLSTSTASVTWTTLKAAGTGATGVGLAVVGGTGCTTAPTSTATFNVATLAGRTPQTSAPSCITDFATLYNAAPATTSTTTATPLAFTSTVKLTVDTPVTWSVLSSATGCIGVTVGTAAASFGSVTAGACGTSYTTGLPQAVVGSNYAFYVETASTATVCFQTDAQKTASAGNCGTVITSSANTMSAAISVFVAMIALIFFN